MPRLENPASSINRLEVVLCTNRHESPSLKRVLASVGNQIRPAIEWRLTVVLNGASADSPAPTVPGVDHTIVRTRNGGLAAARVAAICESWGDIYVFIDDDTELKLDYLIKALDLMRSCPEIGAAGGRILPEFPVPCPPWLEPSLGNLAIRDFGSQRQISTRPTFSHSVPVGAGMVIRKAVGTRFVERMVRCNRARILGRSAASLSGGEDTLLAMGAYDVGLLCAYEPSLVLTHILPKYRLRRRYIARLNFALGRSHAVVCELLGWSAPRQRLPRLLSELIHEYRRLRSHFQHGSLYLFLWQLGFACETRCLWNPDSHLNEVPR